jgi:hypothetical protein
MCSHVKITPNIEVVTHQIGQTITVMDTISMACICYGSLHFL